MSDTAPLHAPGSSPRDWPDDFKHENGNYVCACMYCQHTFFGHKRRIICKECALERQSSMHAGV